MAVFREIITSAEFAVEDFPINDKESQRRVELVCESDKLLFLKQYFSLLQSGKIPFIINSKIPKQIQEQIKEGLRPRRESPGHIVCSSGTTSSDGRVKSFFFTTEQAKGNAKAHNESLEIAKGNILFPLPFTHSFGLVVGIWGTILSNSTCYFSQRSLGAMEILTNLKGIDYLYLTPPQVRQIIKYAPRMKQDIDSPKKISIGSSVLFENEAYQLQKIFQNSDLYYTYGLTEMGPRVSTLKLENLKDRPSHLSIGSPLNGVKMSRNKGLLHIESIFASKDVGLPFNSNDLIEESYVIKGRSDDTIIYQGRNIFPQEIESKLKDYGVVACLGLPSKLSGEVPILIFEEIHPEETVWEYLKQILPETHLPKKILFGENIPRTSLGKIKRTELLAIIKGKV